MRRTKRCAGFMMALALGLSLTAQAPVLAEDTALEELEEILEDQFEQEDEEGLLSQYLKLDALEDAIDDQGLDVSTSWGFTPEALKTLKLEETIPQEARLNLDFTLDERTEEWLVGLGVGLGEDSLIDLSLAWEQEILQLRVPQLLDEAIGLELKDLEGQYKGSALRRLLDENTDDAILQILNMVNAVGAGGLSGQKADTSQQDQELASVITALAQDATVEKSEADGAAEYVLKIPTEDVISFYKVWFSTFASQMEQLGAEVNMDSEEEMQEFYDSIEKMFGEAVEIRFFAENNLVDRIYYSFNVPEDLVQEESEVHYDKTSGEQETQAGTASQTVSSESAGTVVIQIVFNEPTDPWKDVDLLLQVLEADGTDTAITLTKQTEETAASQETTLDLLVEVDGEEQYNETLYRQTFDAATGDYDLTAQFTDTDSGTALTVLLDSTFSGVENGQGFTWTMDELSLAAEGEEIGLTGSVSVSSDPGELAAAAPKMLLELNEGELSQLLEDLSGNAATWLGSAAVKWYSALPQTAEQ